MDGWGSPTIDATPAAGYADFGVPGQTAGLRSTELEPAIPTSFASTPPPIPGADAPVRSTTSSADQAGTSVDNAYLGEIEEDLAPAQEAAAQAPHRFSAEDCVFNTPFQEILDRLSDETVLREADAFEKLTSLAHDFKYAAESYGRIIIAERSLPDDLKTIKPAGVTGEAGGTKYIVGGLLFKFAADHTLIYGSDAAAAKEAGHTLRSLMHLRQVGEGLQGVSVTLPSPDGTPPTKLSMRLPLIMLIDYLGFRLTAMSLMPIATGPGAGDTLSYGSRDASKSVLREYRATQLMREAAKELNLAPHVLFRPGVLSKGAGALPCASPLPSGPGPAVMQRPSNTPLDFIGPADIEIHHSPAPKRLASGAPDPASGDGRTYCVDAARLFPPEPTEAWRNKGDAGLGGTRAMTSYLVRQLRPELVKRNKEPLSSDAFSQFGLYDSEAHGAAVSRAYTWMLDSAIPEFAASLDGHFREACLPERQVQQPTPRTTPPPAQPPSSPQLLRRGSSIEGWGSTAAAGGAVQSDHATWGHAMAPELPPPLPLSFGRSSSIPQPNMRKLNSLLFPGTAVESLGVAAESPQDIAQAQQEFLAVARSIVQARQEGGGAPSTALPPQGSQAGGHESSGAASRSVPLPQKDTALLGAPPLLAYPPNDTPASTLPGLVASMHAHGINVRQMGRVFAHAHDPNLRGLLLCEMLARCVKELWRRTMRGMSLRLEARSQQLATGSNTSMARVEAHGNDAFLSHKPSVAVVEPYRMATAKVLNRVFGFVGRGVQKPALGSEEAVGTTQERGTSRVHSVQERKCDRFWSNEIGNQMLLKFGVSILPNFDEGELAQASVVSANTASEPVNMHSRRYPVVMRLCIESSRHLRRLVNPLLLLQRIQAMCGISLSDTASDDIRKDPEGFFASESPFEDTDIAPPSPVVKQTPLLRYAQGTALFIRARHRLGTPEAVRLGLLAARCFGSALMRCSTHAPTLANYAFLLQDVLKQKASAARLYARGLLANPTHTRTLYYSAQFLRNVTEHIPRNPDPAAPDRKERLRNIVVGLFQAAVDQNPHHANSHKDFANFLNERGASSEDRHKAVALLQAALKASPTHNKVLAALGRLQQYNEADKMAFLHHAACVNPHDISSIEVYLRRDRSARRSRKYGAVPPEQQSAADFRALLLASPTRSSWRHLTLGAVMTRIMSAPVPLLSCDARLVHRTAWALQGMAVAMRIQEQLPLVRRERLTDADLACMSSSRWLGARASKQPGGRANTPLGDQPEQPSGGVPASVARQIADTLRSSTPPVRRGSGRFPSIGLPPASPLLRVTSSNWASPAVLLRGRSSGSGSLQSSPSPPAGLGDSRIGSVSVPAAAMACASAAPAPHAMSSLVKPLQQPPHLARQSSRMSGSSGMRSRSVATPTHDDDEGELGGSDDSDRDFGDLLSNVSLAGARRNMQQTQESPPHCKLQLLPEGGAGQAAPPSAPAAAAARGNGPPRGPSPLAGAATAMPAGSYAAAARTAVPSAVAPPSREERIEDFPLRFSAVNLPGYIGARDMQRFAERGAYVLHYVQQPFDRSLVGVTGGRRESLHKHLDEICTALVDCASSWLSMAKGAEQRTASTSYAATLPKGVPAEAQPMLQALLHPGGQGGFSREACLLQATQCIIFARSLGSTAMSKAEFPHVERHVFPAALRRTVAVALHGPTGVSPPSSPGVPLSGESITSTVEAAVPLTAPCIPNALLDAAVAACRGAVQVLGKHEGRNGGKFGALHLAWHALPSGEPESKVPGRPATNLAYTVHGALASNQTGVSIAQAVTGAAHVVLLRLALLQSTYPALWRSRYLVPPGTAVVTATAPLVSKPSSCMQVEVRVGKYGVTAGCAATGPLQKSVQLEEQVLAAVAAPLHQHAAAIPTQAADTDAGIAKRLLCSLTLACQQACTVDLWVSVTFLDSQPLEAEQGTEAALPLMALRWWDQGHSQAECSLLPPMQCRKLDNRFPRELLEYAASQQAATSVFDKFMPPQRLQQHISTASDAYVALSQKWTDVANELTHTDVAIWPASSVDTSALNARARAAHCAYLAMNMSTGLSHPRQLFHEALGALGTELQQHSCGASPSELQAAVAEVARTDHGRGAEWGSSSASAEHKRWPSARSVASRNRRNAQRGMRKTEEALPQLGGAAPRERHSASSGQAAPWTAVVRHASARTEQPERGLDRSNDAPHSHPHHGDTGRYSAPREQRGRRGGAGGSQRGQRGRRGGTKDAGAGIWR